MASLQDLEGIRIRTRSALKSNTGSLGAGASGDTQIILLLGL